ncbi:MAG TPA: cell division protein SepF [Candidatus Bathyarchaeia archaeon]|nr:cell division protein SepF [Candidatus Bathyarchaeia archaeon]
MTRPANYSPEVSKMERPSIYVKALPLQELDDVEEVKTEIKTGNIVIVRITPLARKSVEQTKLAITELTDHVKSVGGDIARLGEERIVITPPGVRIWRREAAMAEVTIPAESPRRESGPESLA